MRIRVLRSPYDEVTEEFMAQWAAVASKEERWQVLNLVNHLGYLPAASRRVAAAMICAIEKIARPELIP